ncbi:hypothetical protein BDB00DRAFT_158872 [Zychaea mexicana]|uniref:uncharacterized protein n=1 Tax=Zychaea mexicana TaxID=64656 RepID=UPI0022FE4EB9|nr:uncharacterized protein BDB00DRAFT_158872 [Zychaea mexicana]KAI9482632.1 hypothetical protein BDB00DRAFT_158872 [Zychaea mexicana]
MPPSTFNPRRPPSTSSTRLPLHHQRHHHHPYKSSTTATVTTFASRFLHKRWILRLVLATGFLYFLCQQFSLFSTSNSITATGKKLDLTFPELAVAKRTKLTTQGDRIPKIVHFIHGLKGPDPTLDLAHYIAIKAAHDVIQPDTIYLHYHYQPTGELFERAKPMLTLRHVPLIDNIFGRPVQHFAHRADVVRLEALRELGGIYFDLDLFALKSVDHLLDQEFVMGQEGKDGFVGLCNAMMMSRPNSRFLQRYYNSYRTFDMSQWNYHSVVLPGKLAPHFPDEITVLGYKAFFWPLWDTIGLRTMYLEKSYDFAENLGTHIWESPAKKHLMQDLTEETVLNVDTSLYCKIRPYLLDGRPDPRQDACKILAHTERADQLVGHWPLQKDGIPETNPMRADDVSGNQVSGLIRNGIYGNDDGVHLNGEDSYIFMGLPTNTSFHTLTISWWMKTHSDKENGTAVVIQTDRAKIYVRTEALIPSMVATTRPATSNSNNAVDPVSLSLATVLLEDDWSWRAQPDILVHANPFPVNQDDKYHHFVLVIDSDPSYVLSSSSKDKKKQRLQEDQDQEGEQHAQALKHSLHPSLALYMDGHAIASSANWKVLKAYGSFVRGVWFGSSEPEHSNYQDPWDTSNSLKASYRDIQIWERPLAVKEIQQLAPISFSNAPHQDDKVSSLSSTQGGWKEEEEEDKEKGGLQEQEQEQEEEGEDIDQLED